MALFRLVFQGQVLATPSDWKVCILVGILRHKYSEQTQKLPDQMFKCNQHCHLFLFHMIINIDLREFEQAETKDYDKAFYVVLKTDC